MFVNSPMPLSVVILVYNEAEVIEPVVNDFIEKVISRIPNSEFIIAEDGSTDGTKEILARLADRHPAIQLLSGRERKGYVNAFKTAMLAAKNEWILFCDSSGKHDPDDFWKMAPLMREYDMIIGYKEHRKDPFYRIVLTRVFNWLVRRYFKVNFHDVNCPLRLLRRSSFEKISSDNWLLKGLINFELTIRMVYGGMQVAEVPVSHFARVGGPSRGLPLHRIPPVIFDTLKNFRRLKKEMKYKARGI